MKGKERSEERRGEARRKDNSGRPTKTKRFSIKRFSVRHIGRAMTTSLAGYVYIYKYGLGFPVGASF